jgi:hypothetical protein
MNELVELLKIWREAEKSYKIAKSSLDNSLEYILAREELNQARFKFDKACREHVMRTVFNEAIDTEQY